MPPPTITTSAPSIPGHSPELEDELQRGEAGDVASVEWRRYLDEIKADRAGACKDGPEQVERLPGGQPSGRRDLGAWSERRVEGVDVERDVHLLAGQAVADCLSCRGRVRRQLARRDQQDAGGPNELDLFGVVV